MKRFMVSFTCLPRVVFTFGVAALLGSLAVPAHAQVTLDWVTVGDPGNAADTAPAGYGAVADSYQIMKFEFTNSQYAAFLNAIDPEGTNPNSVFNGTSSIDARRGLSNSGTVDGSRYVIHDGWGDKPINFVSWWDAARVSNWLHNGEKTYRNTDSSAGAPQNVGAYSTGTATSGDAVAKNPGALFWVPDENQWYKAAFYTPTLNSGTGGYRVYGNGFDTTPTPVTANATGSGSAGSTGNFANYNNAADWNGLDGNVTTVGTNGGASAYGAFDMSGNVAEWNDLTGAGGSPLGLRGGGCDSDASPVSSSHGAVYGPSNEGYGIGFRLASPVAVPEPSTWVMGLAGVACGGLQIWRRRKWASSRRLLLVCAVIAIAVVSTATPVFAQSVNYELVPVGDPGNAADTTGYGAVPYEYQIGKYEVTIQQYTDFLNAVAKTDPYSLWNESMATGVDYSYSAPNYAGILRGGSTGSYSYSVIGPFGGTTGGADSPGNRSISYVSWFDAARFANWMQNGEGSGSTETGAYTLNGATSGTAPAANPEAVYRLPTENEWYKAAYYKGGSMAAGYWTFATQADLIPGNVIGGNPNQANYTAVIGGWGVMSVTQSASFSNNQNYLTNVGAFVGSPSPYGTFDQNGNVMELNDLTGVPSQSRGLRGGSWYPILGEEYLRSTSRLFRDASSKGGIVGFRLAVVPEPSTCFSLTAGLVFGGWHVFKGRRRRTVSGVSRSIVALLLVTCSVMAGSAHAINYEMVPVGDAGNAADTTGYGAVPYEYQIGKYEVTIGQYAAFLNAVAQTDPYSLWGVQVARGAALSPTSLGLRRLVSRTGYTTASLQGRKHRARQRPARTRLAELALSVAYRHLETSMPGFGFQRRTSGTRRHIFHPC